MADPFAVEAETDAVEVALRPAEVARDAAVPNKDPEVAGGEDGPGISRDFELCCWSTYLLLKSLINLYGSTNLIRVVVYERALPVYLSSYRYNHALLQTLRAVDQVSQGRVMIARETHVRVSSKHILLPLRHH